MYIKELTNAEFDLFTSSFPVKSLFQTKEYAFIMNHQGYDCKFIGLIDSNTIVAATLLIIEKHHGYSYAYAPRGFLINYNDRILYDTFNEKIKVFLGNMGIAAVKLSPMIIKEIYDDKKNSFFRNKNYDYIYNYIKKLDYHHYGYNNYFEAQRPRYEAIINLSLGTEKLYSNIDKSYKTKIRSAKRNGIYIIKGDSNDIKTLYNQVKDKYPRNYKYLSDMYEFFSKNGNADLYLARLNTRDYLVNNQSRYENVYSISQNLNYKLTKQNNNKLINEKIKTDSKLENCKIKVVKATKLIEKYPDGIDLASVLVIKNGSQVQIIIDGYDTNYRDLNAKHLLLWELIKRYANEGYTTFNLGGVSNILLSDNKYAGLNDFKMNFGAYSVEYMGDLEVITNPTLYLLHNNPIKKLIKKKNIV